MPVAVLTPDGEGVRAQRGAEACHGGGGRLSRLRREETAAPGAVLGPGLCLPGLPPAPHRGKLAPASQDVQTDMAAEVETQLSATTGTRLSATSEKQTSTLWVREEEEGAGQPRG